MLYCKQSADNSGRYFNGRFGRWGWTWRTKTKKVCVVCETHRVRGGDRCETCGYPLIWLSDVPRRSNRGAWRSLRHQLANPQVLETLDEYRERRKATWRPGQWWWGRLQYRPLRPGEQRDYPDPTTWWAPRQIPPMTNAFWRKPRHKHRPRRA